MKSIRRILVKEQFHLFNIPEGFAEEAEIIILAIKPAKKYAQFSEAEEFYAANNNQIIEDDRSEDQVWNTYL